ncbi:hypothetical protein [Chitinibacter sp. S2-10]|uniref:hypothetical protein n=1 Tax=Chitinibacter sp. S2-10 TaxID=3373597 RepID=UPI0039775D25
MKAKCIKALIAIPLLLSLAVAHADYVDSFAPRHKLATQLAPALQEAFPQATIRAFSGQLIVSTPDEASFAAIRALADQLDVATRSLRITVEQRAIVAAQSRSVDVDGKVIISNQGSNAQIGIALDESRRNGSANSRQMLTTLDGSAAMIMLGQQRFIPQVSFIDRNGGRNDERIVLHGGVWQSAGNGFYTTPTLLGDGRVNLKLAPQSSRFNADGSIDLHRVYSEVEGRLGEWIPVGETFSTSDSRSDSSDRMAQQNRFSVWLKVELQ